MNRSLARFVTPWAYRRAIEEEMRVARLRGRDGEDCRRCRRPIRFDLTDGHDLGPKIEPIGAQPEADSGTLDHLVLCHRRCNGNAADNTREVQSRIRMHNEAELFAKSRKRARRA